MADDVKIVVTAAPAAEAEAAKPAETSVETLTDNVAIVTFVERELLKIPGVRSKSLYSLAEGDRGFNRNCITFKLTTDYTVRDEDVLAPWKKAFNLRLWQHNAEACKAKTPSGWLRDNMTCEVSETVQLKYWSFKFPVECLSVLREHIAVEKGATAVGVRKVTDFY
jgi:hypothetical protein